MRDLNRHDKPVPNEVFTNDGKVYRAVSSNLYSGCDKCVFNADVEGCASSPRCIPEATVVLHFEKYSPV